MDLGIQGRVALVTAASKGIGYAVAKQLSMEGAKVCICSRDFNRNKEAAAELSEATGNRVYPFKADVTKQHDIENLISETGRQVGQIDILVVNAGGPMPGTFFEVDDEDWHRAWELNLMSAVRLSRLTAPGMLEQKWGRIVYLTSISVKQPIEGLTLSNAVRAAIIGLAKTQALAWAQDNVLVNAVGPGFTRTDRLVDLYDREAQEKGVTFEEILRRKTGDIPIGRMAEPSEIASMVSFLCSEQASYVTGSNIMVDGGLVKGV